MGQVCSGRIKPTKTRPPSPSAPPPYSAPKSPVSATVSEEKEDPPELSSHPALRNRGDSLTDPTLLLLQKPPPAHLSKENQHANTDEKEHDDCSNLSTITAYSTPQWRWSNAQCRAWLTQVLITYGGRPSPVAHRLADSFHGWGPNLYMKEWKEWNAWLGADGQAIFALLMEEHGKEGAVPREVEIEHYVRGEGKPQGEGYEVLEIGVRSRYPLKGQSTGDDGARGNSGKAAGKGKERQEVENFVEGDAVQDVKMQVASEWGKGRLK
ncbi:hypothetical protein BKA64DRAFT_758385 [Cadophora sp. MPI-SDFR-AT-0126]|nr:hypothetical protein BKA64DRAFT_758385 [Leotiomycetes sp. MPI-SDFR-AT-0126]